MVECGGTVHNEGRLVKREDVIKPQTTKFKDFNEVMRLRRCQTDDLHNTNIPTSKKPNSPPPKSEECVQPSGGQIDRVPAASRWLKQVATTGHNLQKMATCNKAKVPVNVSLTTQRPSEKSATIPLSNDPVNKKGSSTISLMQKENSSLSLTKEEKKFLDNKNPQAKTFTEPRSNNSNINRAKRVQGRPLFTGQGKTNPGVCVAGGERKRPVGVRLNFEEIMRQRREHTDKIMSPTSPSRKVTFHESAKLYSGSVRVDDNDAIVDDLTSTLPVSGENSTTSHYNNKREEEQPSKLRDQEAISKGLPLGLLDTTPADKNANTVHNSTEITKFDQTYRASIEDADKTTKGCKMISDFDEIMKRRRLLTDTNIDNRNANLAENRSRMIHQIYVNPLMDISKTLRETPHQHKESANQDGRRQKSITFRGGSPCNLKSRSMNVSKQPFDDKTIYDVPRSCQRTAHQELKINDEDLDNEQTRFLNAQSMNAYRYQCDGSHRDDVYLLNEGRENKHENIAEYQPMLLTSSHHEGKHDGDASKVKDNKIAQVSIVPYENELNQCSSDQSMNNSSPYQETVQRGDITNNRNTQRAQILKASDRNISSQHSNNQNFSSSEPETVHQYGTYDNHHIEKSVSKAPSRKVFAQHSNNQANASAEPKTAHQYDTDDNKCSKRTTSKAPRRKVFTRHSNNQANSSSEPGTLPEYSTDDSQCSERSVSKAPTRNKLDHQSDDIITQVLETPCRGRLRNFEDVMRERRRHTDKMTMCENHPESITIDQEMLYSTVGVVEDAAEINIYRHLEQADEAECFHSENTKPLVGSLTFRTICRNVPSG